LFEKHHTGRDRLKVFRNFRQQDPDKKSVIEAFANVDIKPRYVDYYSPKNWPNTFDIIEEGMLCQSGVTLVIAATLHHFGYTSDTDIKLIAVSNHITGREGLILQDNGNCYNFLPGKIVSDKYVAENSIILDQHIIQPDKLFG
jgi:hypothetical protein